MITLWLVSEIRIHSYNFSDLIQRNVNVFLLGSERVLAKIPPEFSLTQPAIIVNETKYANTEFIIPDFSDIEIKIKEFIEANSYQTSDIQIYCDEELFLDFVAKINQNLGLHGLNCHEMAKFRDKYVMKSALNAVQNFKVPEFMLYGVNDENLFFPSVIKPRALAGSLDTHYFPDKESYAKHIAEQPLSAHMMVEEYITGPLYHCDCLVQNGKVIFYAASKYLAPVMDAARTKTCLGSEVLAIDALEYANLFEATLEAINHLGMQGYMTHSEFILKDNIPYFVETAIRPAGAWINTLYEKYFHFNIFNNHLYACLNIPNDIARARFKYGLGLNPIVQNSGFIERIYIPTFHSASYSDIKYEYIGKAKTKTNSFADGIGEIVLYTDELDKFAQDKVTIANTDFILSIA